MHPIRHLITTVFVATLPLPVLADCETFNPFDDTGNFRPDIVEIVAATNACDAFGADFDISRLIWAQAHVVDSLLADQEFDQAVATAQRYFATAVAHYERGLLDPDHTDILTEAGRRHNREGSHLQQTGMLVVDAETTRRACDDVETLDRLLGFMQDELDQTAERSARRNEEGRVMVAQMLEENALEDWQKIFPEVTSIEEVRNLRQIQMALAPNIEQENQRNLLNTFGSLFGTNGRVEGGRAEVCLAQAFLVHPLIAELTPPQRMFAFPRMMVRIETILAEDNG